MRKLVVTVVVVAALAALPTAGAAAGSPKCSRGAARAAIRQTKLGKQFIGPLRGAPWVITTLICAPLMNGNATDMAALATCCTAASPTPLFIFKPSGGHWTLTYSTDLKTLIDRLQRQGRTLRETRPVYKKSDPLCCPSSFTHWTLRWDGSRWMVRRS
jgi:hypothetical protein